MQRPDASPPPEPSTPGALTGPASENPEAPAERDVILAVLGSANRSGDWIPPERIDVTAGLGSVELDFTQARLPAGVTELNATAVLGSVSIVVPRNVEVDLSGYSILGELQHRLRPEPMHERFWNWLKNRRPSRVGTQAQLTASAPAAPEPGPPDAPLAIPAPSPDASPIDAPSADAAAAPEDAPMPEPAVLVIRGWAVLGSIHIDRV